MAISLKGRNFFALEDFTPEEIRYLLDLAIRLKKESREHIKHQDYIGEDFLLLFEMNSTRTRCAFETSANDLGMGTTFLSNSHFGNTEYSVRCTAPSDTGGQSTARCWKWQRTARSPLSMVTQTISTPLRCWQTP